MSIRTLSRIFAATFIITASLITQSAYALPLGNAAEQAEIAAQPWLATPLQFDRARSVDFTAIVALSNCSGSLVRFRGSLPTDHAMVLTNGHCLEGGFVPPGQVLVNAPSSRSFRLLSKDARSFLGSLRATRVIYGTMTQTDMAIYGLQETYDEIEKRYGVVALTLSDSHPRAGRPITIASGYWRRLYSCSVDHFIYQLREDKWSWSDSILYTQPGCETIGGTSGSPIIDGETREVVGVNNTGNESGGRCTMNNPCEVDQNGRVTVNDKASYGQQTYWIYGCLDAKNQLQLNKPGCLLPKGSAGYRR